MNWSAKLAKSLIKDKTHQRHYFIQVICQSAIALCIATMLISTFLIRGFQHKIEDKIFGFWSHLRISPISNSFSPINNKSFSFDLNNLKESEIKKVNPVASRGVILKNKGNIEGIVLKGIPLDANTYSYTKAKSLNYNPQKELPIIASNYTLDKLNTEIGRTIFINLIDSIPKTIRGKIINSYYTNISEFDAQIAITDIKAIQKLNHWNSDVFNWIELTLKDVEDIPLLENKLYSQLEDVNVESIYNLFPQLFDWLALMKKNEIIIFIVMLIVAIVNVISTISIFVMEKTNLIGILKVLGAKNKSLNTLIFHQARHIILKGILYGNAISIILTAVIYFLEPIKLDPSIYYVDHAPIFFDIPAWIFINIITISVCLISTYLPMLAISRISPVKVVEYN